MARRNISIPDELDKEMSSLNENWSQVARIAFENHIQRISFMNDTNDAMVARLRGEVDGIGVDEGVAWAQDHASLVQLEALSTIDDNFESLSELANYIGVEDYGVWLNEIGLSECRFVENLTWVQGFISGAEGRYSIVIDKVWEAH